MRLPPSSEEENFFIYSRAVSLKIVVVELLYCFSAVDRSFLELISPAKDFLERFLLVVSSLLAAGYCFPGNCEINMCIIIQ